MANVKLLVDIEANSAKLVSEVSRANKSLDGMKKSAEGMKKSLSLISAASVVSLGQSALNAANQIYNFAKSISSSLNDIDRQAKVLGMSTNEFQQWTYVAKMADVEIESLATGFKFLSRNMAEAAAEGKGDAYNAFRVMGVSIKDLNTGALKPLDIAMKEIMDKFAGWADGPEKIALSLKLFGRSGETLIPLLNKGSKGFEELAAEAKKLGIILDPSLIDAGSKMEDSLKRLGSQFSVLTKSIASESQQVVSAVEDILSSFNRLNKWLNENKTVDWFPQLEEFSKWLKENSIENWREKLGFPSVKRQKQIDEAEMLRENPYLKFEPEKSKAPSVKKVEEITYKSSDWIKEWVEGSRELQEMADVITVALYDAARASDAMRASFSMTDEEIKKDTESLRSFEYALAISSAQQAELTWGLKETSGMISNMIEEGKKAKEKFDSIGRDTMGMLSSNMTTLMSATESWGEKFKKVGESILQTLIQIIIKQMLMKALFESSEKGGTGFLGKGSGLGGIFTSIIGLFKAEGGILPGHFTPIRQFAGGGVANGPTLGMIGEGGDSEAVVPLKGGAIPVDMGDRSRQGGTTIIVLPHNYDKSFSEMIQRNPSAFISELYKNARKSGIMKDIVRSMR